MPRKRSNEEWVNLVRELGKGKYEPIEKYINSGTPILVRHYCNSTYDNVYPVRPNEFISKNGRCPLCNGNEAKRKSNSQFLKELFEVQGDKFTPLEKYTARNKKILVRCNGCGVERKMTPYNLLEGMKCKYCLWESRRLSTKEVDTRIKNVLGKSFSLQGKYQNANKEVTILHFICGHTSTHRLWDIISKHVGCVYCNSSVGEQNIFDYLSDKNLLFIPQMKFDDLIDVAKLSYDFYLPTIGVVIEYQGEQHFMPKTFGGQSKKAALTRYQTQIKHDILKQKYALDHNFTLLMPNYKHQSDYLSLQKYLDKYIYI